jgi:hypothetical protein
MDKQALRDYAALVLVAVVMVAIPFLAEVAVTR